MQPGIEPVRVPKRGQITPGSDERVLDGVLGLFGIPEHEPGGGIQAGDRGACQLGEGVMIASPCSLHEVSLHHAPRRGAADLAALVEYGEATARGRSIFGLGRAAWRRGTIAIPSHRPPPGVRRRVKSRKPTPSRCSSPRACRSRRGRSRTPSTRRGPPPTLSSPTAPDKVVIKAQVLVGGRGKAGGVKLAEHA